MVDIYVTTPTDVTPADTGLYITECGRSEIGTDGYQYYRPHGRDDYHLIYMIEKEGVFPIGDTAVTLRPGGFVLIPPHMPHGYRIGGSAAYNWIHFAGTEAPLCIRSQSLTNRIAGVISNEILTLFDEMMDEVRQKPPHYTTVCGALLRRMLALLARQQNMLAPCGVDAAVRAMNAAYSADTTLGEYAAMCGYSKYHFIKLFRTETGMSPIAYRNRVRIQHACLLLEHSAYSLQDIARAVGFADASYFSKVFRHVCGTSPRTHRAVSATH